MTDLAGSLWDRARDALAVARHILPQSPDTAGSRAYFAAFYAVSAHFALKGRNFKKHSAVEAAVHRDLVKPGLWPKKFGANYSTLMELRTVGDYGDWEHISSEDAEKAIRIAGDILQAVSKANPEEFTGLDEI